MDQVLLLTATIAPRTGYYSAIHGDAVIRLGDYKRAFAKYLDELTRGTFTQIIFAENSGHDLSELEAMAAARDMSDRVIFLRIEPGPAINVNVFYLELDLLIKTFGHSAINNIPADAVFWKVTGRYIVDNIGLIVRSAPVSDVYVNCRNFPKRWADFYAIAFNRRAFRCLLELNCASYRTIRTGEEIFRETLDRVDEQSFRIVKRFRHVPRVSGARGRDRFNYGGMMGRLRYHARVIAHKILPRLWI